MSPLISEYIEQLNIQLCTGVTALTLDSGEAIILDFGKGLWFGNRMEKYLINSNQFRKFGIQIYDNPTDPHRKLGIEASADLFTPMETEGSPCGIIM